MLLAGSLNPQEMAVGAAVSLAVAALSLRHLVLLDDLVLSPLLPLHLARYFATFFTALIHANLDVARRVTAPRVRIDPAVVEVHTDLHSDLGKLWLANSITLTPGTLSVDVKDQTLLVHWIDVSPGTNLEVATREIAARFEARLKEFLR
ncbi:MAG: Na+/H+ antiporter subunit E [Hyphomicrobiales bacterium]|nr:Na+/H+ antiporter subunit E [Hyphomicrobiales bacterium]MCP5371302.1 Na+/H+ antiporter subunit E [Hyphomicrobiales bacterium]